MGYSANTALESLCFIFLGFILFSILDRYIGKTIFNTVMMTLFILISLSGIIKFVDQLRKTAQGSYTILSAGYYTLLSVPNEIEIFSPMAALLGSLLGIGRLVQHNELVVMQASGFTRLKITLSVMKTTVPLVLFTMVFSEFIAPKSEKLARNFQSRKIFGDSLLPMHSTWMKNGNSIIYIEHIKNDSQLIGIRMYNFDDEKRLQSLLYAETATWDKKNHNWKLGCINKLDFSDPKKISRKKSINSQWETTLTPDKLGVVIFNHDILSIRGLYNYSKYLKQSGQKSSRYLLFMWSKIFQPLAVVVMTLMALSFIFGPLRSVSIGMRIIIGTSFSLLFYVLHKIVGLLSLVYGLPPALCAILPILTFFAIGSWILIRNC